MLAYCDKRIAVVGATGFIGSHVTERLIESGADVLGIGRSSLLPGSFKFLSRMHYARVDVANFEEVRKLFAEFRPQKVFHLAAQPDAGESFGQMRDCIRQNTEAVLNVLEASAKAQADTFIFGDSSKVYGNSPLPYSEQTVDDPVCSYAVSKAAAWKLCKLYSSLNPNIFVAAVRPTMVYGPRQKINLISFLCSRMDRQETVSIQGGWQTRDPLYIDDAVEAFLKIGVTPETNGHAIPIGGGQELTVSEICRIVLNSFGSDLKLNFDPSSLRTTEIFRSSCDNSDALRLLGWKPRISFQEGIGRLARLSAEKLVSSVAAV